MRLQIVVDEKLGSELHKQAHDLGFSVSSYVRHLIKKSLNNHKQPNLLEQGLDDLYKGNVEEVTLAEFKKQIKDLS